MDIKSTTAVSGVVPLAQEGSTNVLGSMAQASLPSAAQVYTPGGDLALATVTEMNANMGRNLYNTVVRTTTEVNTGINNFNELAVRTATEATTGIGNLAIGGLNTVADVVAQTTKLDNVLELIPTLTTIGLTVPINSAFTKVITTVGPLLKNLVPQERTPVDDMQGVVDFTLASMAAAKSVEEIATVAVGEGAKKAAGELANATLTAASLTAQLAGQGLKEAIKGNIAGKTPKRFFNKSPNSSSTPERIIEETDEKGIFSLALPITMPKQTVVRKRTKEESQESDTNPNPVLVVLKRSKSEDKGNAGGSSTDYSALPSSNSESGNILKQDISIYPGGNQKLRLNPEAGQEVCTLNGELYIEEPLILEEPLVLDELTIIDDYFLIVDQTLTDVIVFLQDVKEKTSGPDTSDGESHTGNAGVDPANENNRIDYIIGNVILWVLAMSAAYKVSKVLTAFIEKNF